MARWDNVIHPIICINLLSSRLFFFLGLLRYLLQVHLVHDIRVNDAIFHVSAGNPEDVVRAHLRGFASELDDSFFEGELVCCHDLIPFRYVRKVRISLISSHPYRYNRIRGKQLILPKTFIPMVVVARRSK